MDTICEETKEQLSQKSELRQKTWEIYNEKKLSLHLTKSVQIMLL